MFPQFELTFHQSRRMMLCVFNWQNNNWIDDLMMLFLFFNLHFPFQKKKKTKSSDFYKSSLPQFISLYNKSLRVHKILYYDVVVSVKWYASKLPLRSLHRLLVPFLLKNYLIELLLNVCVNITRWTRIFGHQWCRVKWLFMRYFYPLVALFVRINH